jgi:hypothetical protein
MGAGIHGSLQPFLGRRFVGAAVGRQIVLADETAGRGVVEQRLLFDQPLPRI